jgi:hypothetical protein
MKGNEKDVLYGGWNQDKFCIGHSTSNGLAVDKHVIINHNQGLPQRRMVVEKYVLEGILRQCGWVTNNIVNMQEVRV